MENKDSFEEFGEETKLPEPKQYSDRNYYEDRTEREEKKENAWKEK